MLGAGRIRASFICWLGVARDLSWGEGERNLNPEFAGPECGCFREGFNTGVQPGMLISVGINIKRVAESS